MLIHDNVFKWKGWGGDLNLGSGKCRLRVYDLNEDVSNNLTPLWSYIVMVTDIEAAGDITVRGWSGHIATSVIDRFGFAPRRMMYMEHYPPSSNGESRKATIPERYEIVEFDWKQDQAVTPRWRELTPPILNRVIESLEA